MVVGVTGGYFRIVADPQEEGGHRKPSAPIERRSRGHGKVVRTASQVMRQQIQILVAEIQAGLDDVPSFVHRPVVAVPPHVLDLLQGMAEGVLTESTEEIVAGRVQLWQPEIDGRARNAGNSKSAAREILRA